MSAVRGKTPHMTKEQKAEIRKMFLSGMHINDIWRKTGWCHATLVKLRPF